MKATFYCDESGNTGTDWMNPDQRVFVHGGWVVQHRGMPAITNGVNQIRRRHRLQAAELKWTQLSKRSESAAIFREIFVLMKQNGGLPVFQVVDKEYMTAAKVVETFFDPAYNRTFVHPLTDFETKKRLVERIVGAPLLVDFADTFLRGRRADHRDVRRVANELAAHLTQRGHRTIAMTLHTLTDSAVDDILLEFDVDPWNRTTGGHTLWAVLQNLEQLLRTQDLDVDILHDNLVRFDDLFADVGRMFGRHDLGPVRVVNGRVRFHSMPRITGLRLVDSKTEPYIQLADLLCGFVRTLAEKLKDGVPPSPDESAVLVDLAGFFQEFATWNGNLPDAMFAEFFRPWFETASRATHSED
ncbi:hypothetical protein J2X85_004082 [Microbacterium trichothecenolyticum]|uniref:DUF3800 domain-containing protein n=1 Tax=Microbacterium trichothecenolyticum TaxID=69370 RepID=UPI00285F2052|nr:DUF3800 domain-containing protein [Microbacterium trichothecenolyticum]MDR7187021.1 hypothetical protein [Microbacterium trichothecenolyticum]